MRIGRACLLVFLLSALDSSRAAAAESSGIVQKGGDFVFEIHPRIVAPGETAVLRWSIKGATRVSIEEGAESKRELRNLGTFDGGRGTLEVKPRENTTYVIICEGSTTYTCASVSVRVRVKRR